MQVLWEDVAKENNSTKELMNGAVESIHTLCGRSLILQYVINLLKFLNANFFIFFLLLTRQQAQLEPTQWVTYVMNGKKGITLYSQSDQV